MSEFLFSTYITLFVDFHFLNEAVDKGSRYYLPFDCRRHMPHPTISPKKGEILCWTGAKKRSINHGGGKKCCCLAVVVPIHSLSHYSLIFKKRIDKSVTNSLSFSERSSQFWFDLVSTAAIDNNLNFTLHVACLVSYFFVAAPPKKAKRLKIQSPKTVAAIFPNWALEKNIVLRQHHREGDINSSLFHDFSTSEKCNLLQLCHFHA